MMLRHLGWTEAADLVVTGMEGAKEVPCSESADAVIARMA
jgi:hypothetical protein